MKYRIMNYEVKKGLFWNYISLAVAAVAGLMLNILIEYFYKSSVLGIFNETYAWYMILSQISVWGIHMSVLKFVPEQECEIKKRTILKSAILITSLIATLFITFIELTLFLFKNVEWQHSLRIASIGLVFFSLNKVLLNYLNALSEMVDYAVFQILRYIMLIFSVLAISLLRLESNWLALAFPVTESIVLVILLIYIYKRNWLNGVADSNCIKNLIIFGTKILPSNMVMEMNTKVDIVCLSFLVVDTAQIGVYSFAIVFSEGFYQLYITIRKIVDPKIAEANVHGRLEEFMMSVRIIAKKYFIAGTIMIYSGVLFAYFLIYKMVLAHEYRVGIIYLAIICSAIAINGKEVILGDMFAQVGYPIVESRLNVITVLSNIIFNIIFITLWGTIGAAAATALSHFVYGVQLKKAVKMYLGIDI